MKNTIGKLLRGSVVAVCLFVATNLMAEDLPGVAKPFTRVEIDQMFKSMRTPIAPRHLVGNIYYVGTEGISSFLISTSDGLILIDSGFESMVPGILNGVKALGFEPRNIKYLLSSHAHIDHVGGHALMQKLTGAKIIASAADARIIESGGVDDFIPFPRDTISYTPVKVDRIVANGGHVQLGDTVLTAVLTPCHTRGATTWTTQVRDGDKTYNVVFFSSATINRGTSLLARPAYPGIVDDYRSTIQRLKDLPCDIFFAPHNQQFGMSAKFAKQDQDPDANPFVDPEGWRNLIANVESMFNKQLEAEQKGLRSAAQ